MTTRRALLSVYDKAGIVPFAQGLVEAGFELVSSGGTSSTLAAAGVAHISVDELTGFPEMLDGRVKTLHPRLHAGILADRSKPDHLATIASYEIAPIDIVACNLYPFTSNPSIELIDVGGPSMVRAGAKNHAAVAVIVDPARYDDVLSELREHGAVTAETRKVLASEAFAHTAEYDTAIAAWFADEAPADGAPADEAPTEIDNTLPETLSINVVRAEVLRYGENPHQHGARYRFANATSWWDGAEQLGGKELSYLNVYDTDAAWRLVHDLTEPSVAIIKHANPCGAASAADITDAYNLANACDPVSAFGGIVAINCPVTGVLATSLGNVFTEVVVAPAFDDDALAVFATKKNLRVLRAPAPGPRVLDFRSVDGGLLAQDPDDPTLDDVATWRCVTSTTPTVDQLDHLRFAWIVCAHVKSNAIVIGNGLQAVGIGAGQQSRVDSAQIAVRKAGERAVGGVCASDAFFPFRDGIDLLAAAGIKVIVQPGGSVRDEETIAACNEHGIAMLFTGVRHFRH